MNKKKLMALILIASASASPLLGKENVYAANAKPDSSSMNDNSRSSNKGQVINVTTSLRVRSGAGTSHSTIGYLKNGQTISIKGKSGSWYKIDFENKTGYISEDFVKLLNGDTNQNNSQSKSKGKVINITSSLRMRSGAGTSHSTVAYLRNGQEFDILGKSGDWYKIKAEGKEGFVHKDYVKVISGNENNNNNNTSNENKPTTVKGQGQVVNVETALRVRSKANTSSSIKGYIYNGDKVEVLEKTGNWYKIKKGNLEGYTSSDYIKITNSDNSNNKPEQKPDSKPDEKPTEIKGTGKVINITSSLNVRSGASTSHSIVGTLHNGDSFDVIGKSGSWYKIKKGSMTGYVSQDFVKYTPEADKPSEKPDDKPEVTAKKGKVVNVTSSLNIRSGASTNHSVVGVLHEGDTFDISGKSGNWYKIKKGSVTGYVNEDYVKVIDDNGGDTSKPDDGNTSKPDEKPGTEDKTGVVNVSSSLNVRKDASTTSDVVGQLRNGDRVTIKGEKNGFYRIQTNSIKDGYASKDYIKLSDGTEGGTSSDGNGSVNVDFNGPVVHTNYSMTLDDYIKLQQSRVPSYSYSYFEQYINPERATNRYQFLRIDRFRDIDVTGLNSYLSSKDAGVLKGTASAFRSAAKNHNIDPIYFVSQSIHETGYGKSKLAKGVQISEIANPDKPIYNSKGQLIGYEMIKLSKPTTVYNLFGIGAYDNSDVFPNRALIMGTTYAYNKGWTSIEKAIDGAAEFVSLNYVNSSKYEQNTLYKMRYMQDTANVWHQYATSPWYAQSIGSQMSELSNLYKSGNEYLYDVPKFSSSRAISFKSIPNNTISKKENLPQSQTHVPLEKH
ncbi:SH3 domain-containing protein [Clostridium sp. LY3-2]|uniref:SH3 domain-containing protein n=1 Tax=Clostridium sp. LY3-2 TaxID=2942482 RepID=UPI002152A6AE|nr:SH3 domain-containing protein [Clostridium sp. LY3-2]MCR6516459.1 SH3 domain-containing protein [Clostridium sp. LY3-2]